jgi:Fe-S-cluster containining protein
LSFHAAYGCGRRGICCAAGWPVPVEGDRLAGLRQAVGDGTLGLRIGTEAFDAPAGTPPDTPARLARPDGRCVFFDSGERATCRVHATVGHDALPLACRQFPRVTVQDPRGASITLSHFCPTAAEMLDTDRPVSVAINAEGFPVSGEYIGLDATTGVPPLLRPDMAMDWESWWEWERFGSEMLAREAAGPDETLARLRGAVEHLRTWTPGGGPLIDVVRRAFASASPIASPVDVDARVEEVRRAIPDGLRPPSHREAMPDPPAPRVHRHFLAAHAFANWTAHLGLGLRTWLRSIEAAHALLTRGHRVGEADLWLRHLADPNALAQTWSEAEATSRP